MKLYVCYATFGGEHHACARAHQALAEAGHEFEVEKTYGCFRTDRFWSGRREVHDLTGNYKVPTLVLDDGTVIDESQRIVDWAAEHPAGRQASVA